MKFRADDYLKFDSETNTYYMEPDQIVRDQVEKDYWKTTLSSNSMISARENTNEKLFDMYEKHIRISFSKSLITA